MDARDIKKILSDTAYVRTGGSPEEARCAEYIKARCEELGVSARIEPFSVEVYTELVAELEVDGERIACKSHYGSPDADVEGELYYLEGLDEVSLRGCRGKVVLVDKPVGYRMHDELFESGALAYISCAGGFLNANGDIDRREMRFDHLGGGYLPGVGINICDTWRIVRSGGKRVRLRIKQSVSEGVSHNVVADIGGECDETVLVCAHYDSTELSLGSYDNMSGCIALLYIAEALAGKPLKRGVRLLWCGSEERGLLGSIAYCKAHKAELQDLLLNVNLDMLGSVLGAFNAMSCANEETTALLESFVERECYAATVKYGIRSSDSNSFVYYGVPAVSFARYAPADTAPIHTLYDTPESVSPERLCADSHFIYRFTEYLATAEEYPLSREISQKIADDVDEYMSRKRGL